MAFIRRKGEVIGTGILGVSIKNGKVKTKWLKKPSQSRKKAPRTKGNPKDKVWSLKRADTEFRAFMLKTVPVRCVFPNCQETRPEKLTVSHYFGRVKKATRFDTNNCDFLCRTHHYWDKQLGWEFQKQMFAIHGWDGQYTKYMEKKLGRNQFWKLEELAREKIGPKKAIQAFQASLTT